MKRIIYVFFGVLSKCLYDALLIDNFLENKVEVELIDITEVLFSYKANQIVENVISINSYKKLEEYFHSNDNVQTLYNIQIHFETRFLKLFLLLKKYNCKTSIFEIGYLPSANTEQRMKKYLKQPLQLVKRVVFKIVEKLLVKLNFIDLKYDVRFVAGNISREIASYNSNRIVEINYIDYEYNRYRSSVFKNKKNYFVFLDNFLHGHEDHNFANTGNINNFSKKKYIKNLNNFFDKIEKKFNVEIIIAAHPKSDYSENEFENRKIIKNDTASLLQNADAVISHHSTSISYAVLNEKPIIFIYDESIKVNFRNVYMYIEVFANYLHMPFVNIDSEKISSMPVVLESKYNDYKYSFLTTKNSEQFTNKQIIEGFIKNEMFFY